MSSSWHPRNGLMGWPTLGSLGSPGPFGKPLADIGWPPPPPPTPLPSAIPFAAPMPLAGVSSLFDLAAASPPVVRWQFVRRRFTQLCGDLAVTRQQHTDGETKQAGIRACLNRHYWNTSSHTANSMLIGSWGKQTRVRPSRDIDILFLLPPLIYHQFQERSGNRQSQLLQEVKDVLARTYSQTTIRGDGQVVVVPFNTTPVEIAPGFRCTDGSIIVCDTNNGGRYKTSTAEAELAALNASDTRWNGNTRALARMMKRWQRECNVPLKSFQLERLAVEFLQAWAYSHQDAFYYDWMVRDFLAYLISRADSYIIMPGTGEFVWLGSDWLTRAQTAHRHAVSACRNERDSLEASAGWDWQEIFGSAVAVFVS
jgi:Second Messenger Oligonucleotide or Dinucleotide Synthetase domain